MSEQTPMPPYFPPRPDREVLAIVVTAFPYPLALTYARLQVELDRQEPVAAAWQLRDAFECVLKFVACLAAADCLRAEPDPAVSAALVGRLLKPQGISIGDWHTILEESLRPIELLAREGRLDASPRLLSRLFPIFFESNGRKWRRSAINRSINDGANSFVRWRNAVFGHGVFRTDRTWYAAETLAWLPQLHAIYHALAPVLAEWRLVSTTAGDEEVIWQGVDGQPSSRRHEHEPLGAPVPMDLVSVTGTSRRLPLAPYLSIQQCGVCGQPAVFFLDKRKPPDRLDLLEYDRGHLHTSQPWGAARQLAALLPSGFTWERTVHDLREVTEGLGIVLRDFATEYQRPSYLLDLIWHTVDEQTRGYIWLTGPSGTGKTYVVRGLAEEGPERGVMVLAYHVLPGALTDYRTFITELADMVKATLGITGLQEIQTNVRDRSALQGQVAIYLGDVMRLGRLDTLVVAIDGLDELSEPGAQEAALTTLLPAPNELPEGCTILLTSGEQLRPSIEADLDRLQRETARAEPGAPLVPFTRLTIVSTAEDNLEAVGQYLERESPERFRATADNIAAVLERSGGIFLYAFHLARALTSGAFTDVETLPVAEQFYPSYLARLAERVGPELYTRLYLPILLLMVVVRQAVTLAQLRRWGIAEERLQFSLLDLRDFLRVERARLPYESLALDTGENRYQLAHEAFARFARADPELSSRLREAHATIGRVAYHAHAGTWQEVDPRSEEDLYDLLHVLDHLRGGGLNELAEQLSLDGGYAAACFKLAGTADDLSRYALALNLYEHALLVCRSFVASGRNELVSDLARTLAARAIVLAKLGHLEQALAGYDEALRILRPLIRDGGDELVPSLATALMNRATTLQELGRFEEALVSYDEALLTLPPLVAKGDRSHLVLDIARHLTFSLATVLINRANALAELGSLEEALVSYDKALAAYSTLLQDGRGELELAHNIAGALVNRAIAFRELGRLEEALAGYDEALLILRPIVQAGWHELASRLANTLVNRGATLRELDRMEDALTSHDEALRILRSLVQDGRDELVPDLTDALMNRGIALAELNRSEEALADLDEAVATYHILIEAGRRDLEPNLAGALANRATALIKLNQLENALAGHDEALAAYRALVRNDRGDLVPNLTLTMMNRADALQELDRLEEALVSYDEAANMCDVEVQEGKFHLIPLLLRALNGCTALALSMQRWHVASAQIVRACHRVAPLLEAAPMLETIGEEWEVLLRLLQPLSDEDREQVYALLGDWADRVCAWVREVT